MNHSSKRVERKTSDTKGKLKAQQALAQYYKSLVDEQKRRKVAAQ